VRLGTRLEEVGENVVRLTTGESIPTRIVVWTTGVAPHPSLKALSVPLNDHGRVPVNEFMGVQGLESVWAVGDCAAVPSRQGGVSPMTAQFASRQGSAVARNVAASLGVGTARPFRYRNRGSFVNLGRHKAVAMTGPLKFRGFPAWWMARTYHLSQIPGSMRKVRAVVDWTVGLPFGRDTAEVGSIGHPRPLRADEYARGGTHRPIAQPRQ
jgi:NADH:ubiquinone reductase (H+-translocating)